VKKFIPVNQPLIKKSDINSVIRCLEDGWISSEGANVKKFEKNFSRFIGHKYGVAVSSGTAALEIAIKALNLKKGDEIIIPNFTIISNILPALKFGIKFKLIDCNIFDWNLNLSKINELINKNTKVIIATHIYNFPIRMDILKKICLKKKIFIIEDAAEVIGQKIFNKKCGSFGDISTFSFYANKQITTGEGGMITTNNKLLSQKFESLRNLAFGKKDRFNHDDIGWNYRMTNIQASIGLSQLKRIGAIIKKRHQVGKRYYNNLKNNKNIYIPEPERNYAKNIYWVVGILIMKNKSKLNAKKVMAKLKEKNIDTRPFFWPMHKQKILSKHKFNSKNYKNSEYISNYGFYLPTSLKLNNSDIDYVCECVNEIFR
jgi:perosamine synthetase